MTVEITKRVRHAKAILTAGDIVNLTQREEKRLTDLGYARSIKVISSDAVVDAPAAEIDKEYYDEAFADLKANFSKTQLIEAATDAGVDFDPKSKQDDIIDAVIRQGKVDELLVDEDE